MKSRDEYLESIYNKKDKFIIKRKKTVSVIASMACLAICFITVFSLVPKKLVKNKGATEPVNGSGNSNSVSIDKIVTEKKTTVDGLAERYTLDSAYAVNETTDTVTHFVTYYAAAEMNDGTTRKNGKNENSITEIAPERNGEATTRNNYFGSAGDPFDPDKLLSGNPAIAPENPPEDYVIDVTGSDYKKPGSDGEEKTVVKTSAAKPKSPEDAVAAAKDFLQNEDAAGIIDEKTQTTVTRTSSGETTYNVYFYTENKSFIIEVDGVTLRIISCAEKNLITGKESFISLPWFPETTEALPEYKPQ